MQGVIQTHWVINAVEQHHNEDIQHWQFTKWYETPGMVLN